MKIIFTAARAHPPRGPDRIRRFRHGLRFAQRPLKVPANQAGAGDLRGQRVWRDPGDTGLPARAESLCRPADRHDV